MKRTATVNKPGPSCLCEPGWKQLRTSPVYQPIVAVCPNSDGEQMKVKIKRRASVVKVWAVLMRRGYFYKR